MVARRETSGAIGDPEETYGHKNDYSGQSAAARIAVSY
jgi:hypothetical protein